MPKSIYWLHQHADTLDKKIAIVGLDILIAAVILGAVALLLLVVSETILKQ